MNAERYNRIDRIAQAAVESPANVVAAYLDSACGGDQDLRREVESLILYQQKANSFLEEPALKRAAELIAGSRDESVEGRTIANYRIERRIGAGGMGEVYLAEDTKLDRKVAIKFLPHDVASDELARKRLIREARAAAKLDHPNICAVHEVNEEDSHTFIVMQYVEGETLSSRIERSPLETAEVLDIAVQVADALSEAHSRGIVHRDIKPANIMLTARGGVRVLDFGLAKVTDQRQSPEGQLKTDQQQSAESQLKIESLSSEAGMVAGTVPYMSPEQVSGEAIDGRSDIFSFGAVLYEMMSGHQPFQEESAAETISAILTRETPSLSNYSTEMPPELERIVGKALRKDRDHRYQSAKDLLIDLNDLKHRLEFEAELERSKSPEEDGDEGTSLSGRQPAIAAAKRPTSLAEEAVSGPAEQWIHYLMKVIIAHERVVLVAVSAMAVIVASVAYLLYFPTNGKAVDSIAVLPLVNAGNDPETEYLSDGIAESLINSLSQFPQLRVVPRTTAFRYKEKEIDPRQVGRDLGVQAILTGRVIQRGDTLDMQVGLVETSNGSQIWGAQYNRKASDLLAVRREMARKIIESLRLRLIGEDEKRLTRGDAGNTEAYGFYLKGRHFWNRRTAANLKKAIEQFQHAIERDPNYALAYIGLADCYVLLEEYASTPSSETLPKARAVVQRALQIDESLAEAHAVLGMIEQNSWNFSEAEREHNRAIELNPNYATAHHWYGFYLRLVRGRFDEAMAEIRLAQRLEPLSPVIGTNLAQVYINQGELYAAIEEANKALELDPNFPLAYGAVGVVYQRQGRYEEAIAELEKAVELSGGWSLPVAHLGVCYAVAGKRGRARATLKELEEKYGRREALGQHVAGLYAALGDKNQAFAWLEKDFQARSGLLPWIAYEPWSDTLRDALSSDPRWNDLLRRIGLPPQ